ncbi:MAG: hypothetical protein IIZ68_11145 [Clostridia bacterium]|nr:hypothetical protein [Clostridia bacterium]MBQ5544456.1 hypothetical protein [Clostridia bacterium]
MPVTYLYILGLATVAALVAIGYTPPPPPVNYEEIYPSTPETELRIGVGRFQIRRSVCDTTDGKYLYLYTLIDLEGNMTVETDLFQYYNDEGTQCLYAVGSKGYTVLRYGAGSYEQHGSLTECDGAQKEVFCLSDKFKPLVKQVFSK